MYADDNLTPKLQNSLSEPPPPVSFGQQGGGQKPGRKSVPPNLVRLLPWIVCGLLLVLVLVFGALWLSAGDNKGGEQPKSTSSTSSETKDEEATPAERCTAKQRRYQNRDLSLGFCYPSSWGDVSVNDAKFDPSDDGTRLKLSFSEKPQVHIGLVSDDWSTDTARDGVCADPARQALPDFASFSARWATEGPEDTVSSATRGLEIATDDYIIEEHVDNLLTNGVCIEGFKLTRGEVFRHAVASYSAGFSPAVASPQAHINDPIKLVPVADRTAFIELVKSMYPV